MSCCCTTACQKRVKWYIGGVIPNGIGSAYIACLELKDGAGGYEPLSCPHHALHGLVFKYCAIHKPHCDVAGQEALRSSSVKDGDNRLWKTCYL